MIDKCQGCGRREPHEVPSGCLHSVQAQLNEIQFHALQTILSRLDQLEEEYAELLTRLDEHALGDGAQRRNPAG